MNLKVYKAYLFAKKAHKGQKDKSGKKYITHPLRVSKRMKTTNEKIVALLHDVVEDTKYTLSDIEKRFGKEIKESVALLTHDESVPYDEYIDNILKDKIATRVKLSDLIDNMNFFRLKQKDFNSHMVYKYNLYARSYVKIINHMGKGIE